MEVRTGDRLDEPFDPIEVAGNGNNDDLFWAVGQPQAEAFGERVFGVDGRDDDRYILATVRIVMADGDGLVLFVVLVGEPLLVPGPDTVQRMVSRGRQCRNDGFEALTSWRLRRKDIELWQWLRGSRQAS